MSKLNVQTTIGKGFIHHSNRRDWDLTREEIAEFHRERGCERFTPNLELARDMKRHEKEKEFREMLMEMPILELLHELEYEHDVADYSSFVSYSGSPMVFFDSILRVLRDRKDEIKNDTYFKYSEYENQGWYSRNSGVRIKRPPIAKMYSIRPAPKSIEPYIGPILFWGFTFLIVSCVTISIGKNF